MAHWAVHTYGDARDLDYLSRSLTGNPCRFDRDRDGQYILLSEAFVPLTVAREVHAAGQAMLRVASGIARLRLRSTENLSAGGVLFFHDDGRRDVHMIAEGLVISRLDEAGPALRALAGIPYSPPTPATATEGLAARDQAVAHYLVSLTLDDASTWTGLYRSMEIIRADVGNGRALTATGWISESDYRRLTGTANSPAGAGPMARHGVGGTVNNPISLDEARRLMISLGDSWIRHKDAGAIHPERPPVA